MRSSLGIPVLVLGLVFMGWALYNAYPPLIYIYLSAFVIKLGDWLLGYE